MTHLGMGHNRDLSRATARNSVQTVNNTFMVACSPDAMDGEPDVSSGTYGGSRGIGSTTLRKYDGSGPSA